MGKESKAIKTKLRLVFANEFKAGLDAGLTNEEAANKALEKVLSLKESENYDITYNIFNKKIIGINLKKKEKIKEGIDRNERRRRRNEVDYTKGVSRYNSSKSKSFIPPSKITPVEVKEFENNIKVFTSGILKENNTYLNNLYKDYAEKLEKYFKNQLIPKSIKRNVGAMKKEILDKIQNDFKSLAGWQKKNLNDLTKETAEKINKIKSKSLKKKEADIRFNECMNKFSEYLNNINDHVTQNIKDIEYKFNKEFQVMKERQEQVNDELKAQVGENTSDLIKNKDKLSDIASKISTLENNLDKYIKSLRGKNTDVSGEIVSIKGDLIQYRDILNSLINEKNQSASQINNITGIIKSIEDSLAGTKEQISNLKRRSISEGVGLFDNNSEEMFKFTPSTKKKDPHQPLNVEVNNVVPANVTHTIENVKPFVESSLLKDKNVTIETSSKDDDEPNSTNSEELIENNNNNSHGRYSNRNLFKTFQRSSIEPYKRFKNLF